MQLILDAETTIDIQNKMSGMSEETFDEKFTKSIIEKFSNDLHHEASDLKDISLLADGKEKENLENNIPNGESNNQEENTDIPTIISNIESKVNNEENERSSDDLDNSIERRHTTLTEDYEKGSDVIDDVTKVQSDIIYLPKLVQDEKFRDEAVMPSDDQCKSLDDIIKLDSNLDNFSESTECGTNSNAIKSIEHGNIADENSTENKLTSNLEAEVKIKLDCNKVEEQVVEQKRDDEDLVKTLDGDDGKLKTDGENDLDSNGVLDKTLPNTENTKDEDVISNALTDSINTNNIEFNTIEIGEKVELREKLEESEQTEKKSNCLDHANHEQQMLEDKEEIVNEGLRPCDKTEKQGEKKKSLAYKLSNTLDILSDDEDEQQGVSQDIENVSKYSQNISLVDDDDVMLIEEDIGEKNKINTDMVESISEVTDISNTEKQSPSSDVIDTNKDAVIENNLLKNELDCTQKDSCEKESHKPILPSSFLKTCKKNLADMTREDLEEFCILKIVESVIDKSNLGDIKAQLKTMARNVEEYKKKLSVVTKQTKDLQLILKSVQEAQMKSSVVPITPLKITRSVGMQVFMTDRSVATKKSQGPAANSNLPLSKTNNNSANIKKNNQQIPVPRLVPAATPTNKNNSTTNTVINNVAKPSQTNNAAVNGMRNSPPVLKPEKRTRLHSVTVDLTDDEPPSKMVSRSSPAPPVRLIPPQNLLAPQRQPFALNINSPRKVYIPISSPQAQNIRPGQTILLRSVPPNPGPRPRGPSNSLARMQSNSIRMNKVQSNRHPAPLPDAMKQYQPPNWKALPPAPDLMLSKVDNGIVISWKIDGYQVDSYEEISSYQIFAYQETTCPPSTALWKKIGDVKALPLPMACTLTQFMPGYKYYFSVRAVDVKSRLGPFSLPGSIHLLNKV